MTTRNLSRLSLAMVATLLLSACNSGMVLKSGTATDITNITAADIYGSGTPEPDTVVSQGQDTHKPKQKITAADKYGSGILESDTVASQDKDTRKSKQHITAADNHGSGILESDTVASQDKDTRKTKHVVSKDLWERVRNGFSFKPQDNKRITQRANWYKKHPSYIKRLQKRARPYIHFILEQAEKRGLPTELVLLPAVESAYRPFAYSHGRAAGLWQFVPATGRHFNLKQNWWYDGRRDVVASTHAAFDYLESLAKRFKGDWNLALAAYNSGAGTVSRAIAKNKREGKPTDYWSLKLPTETRNYVPRLLALAQMIRNPDKFGATLKPMPDTPYFDTVDIGSQLDLALAADMAGMSTDNLYRLNPGFNRWATAPDGPHQLNIPVNKCKEFNKKLAELAPEKRIRWKRYKVRDGDSLSTIAEQYGTTAAMLKQANKLNNNGISAGKHLVIPMSTKSLDHYALSADKRKQKIQNRKRKGKRIEHIVEPGDTLWDLAKVYKVNHTKLARWNGMAPRDPLSLGQKLVVWVDSKKYKASEIAQLPSIMDIKPPSTTNSVHYRVRNGDSLARIAERFKVPVADLKRWNTIEGEYLKAGQNLKLYVDVTAQTL